MSAIREAAADDGTIWETDEMGQNDPSEAIAATKVIGLIAAVSLTSFLDRQFGTWIHSVHPTPGDEVRRETAPRSCATTRRVRHSGGAAP